MHDLWFVFERLLCAKSGHSNAYKKPVTKPSLKLITAINFSFIGLTIMNSRKYQDSLTIALLRQADPMKKCAVS